MVRQGARTSLGLGAVGRACVCPCEGCIRWGRERGRSPKPEQAQDARAESSKSFPLSQDGHYAQQSIQGNFLDPAGRNLRAHVVQPFLPSHPAEEGTEALSALCLDARPSPQQWTGSLMHGWDTHHSVPD